MSELQMAEADALAAGLTQAQVDAIENLVRATISHDRRIDTDAAHYYH